MGIELLEPKYDFDGLMQAYEDNELHRRIIDQKVKDVIGHGIHLSLPKGYELDNRIKDGQDYLNILEWWESLFVDSESVDSLRVMWRDYEILGWCMFEVVRNSDRIVSQLLPVPASTMRVAIDGYRYAQTQGGRTAWFKCWGMGEGVQIMSNTGLNAPRGTGFDELASELLVFRKPSRDMYSAPAYISGLGFITGLSAEQDDSQKAVMATEVLIAHRMSPFMLPADVVGKYGIDVSNSYGYAPQVVNQIYKDSVIGRSQSILEAKLQNFVTVEFNQGEPLNHHVAFRN